MLARYRIVLAVPGCARLFATALAARLPQGMLSLSTLLLVRGATHSYAVAGLAVGAEALASAAAGPPQGRFVDRFGRARVLAPCAALQACLLVALVLAAGAHLPGSGLVVLAAAAGALQPAIAPSVRALLRELLTDHDVRETAYALESVIQELIWITGPLLVAVVIAVVSPAGAVLLSAAVCVCGTALFVTSPATGDGHRRAHERGPAVIRSLPELRAMLVPVGLMGCGIGAIDVGLPSLALHAGSRPSSGLLLALWSLGSLLGGLLYGSRSWRLSLAERYRRLLMISVACAFPLVIARTIPEGMVGALLAGVTIAPVFSCQYALVGRVVTPGLETEAFTWVSAALVAGLAAGSALGGVVISGLGVGAPFVVACLALTVAALTSARARGVARVAV